MKITILGSGTSSGVPLIGCDCAVCRSDDRRDKRLRASALFEVGGKKILIDCGADFRQQYLNVGCPKLDAICLTHHHYDHIGGLEDLRPARYFAGLKIYGDERCVSNVKKRLDYCFVSKAARYSGVPDMELETIEPSFEVLVGDVAVLPIRVYHGKLPILGYRIGDVAYITDMSRIDDEAFLLLKGIKILIVNALHYEPHLAHQNVEQAIAFSLAVGRLNGSLPATYFIHMSHRIGLHAQTSAQLPEHCKLAYDGMMIEL